jgi:hypothetical protein
MQQALLDVAAEDPFLAHPLGWVRVSIFINHEHYNVSLSHVDQNSFPS